MTQTAPYHTDVAGNPDGECHWLTCVDGVRVRVGHWRTKTAETKGTVLLFPGRTEYIEKYGSTAADLTAQGFACATIDWRGQGIADRLLDDRAIGHVDVFEDYQLDAKALLLHVQKLGLPEPYFLLAHSMGGCIGLRSLNDGLPVKAVAFSAPMWGIKMSPALRPIAWGLSSVSRQLGFSEAFAPGQKAETYVLRAGPSLHWLNESLREMRHLSHWDAPDLPCITFLGTEEAIVDPARIHERMDRWANGKLVILDGGRHEVLMERAELRDTVIDEIAKLFTAHSPVLA